MRTKIISLTVFVFFVIVFLSACGNNTQSGQESVTLPAVTDTAGIIAEGKLEPIYFAEIAFNASGVVSEVLVEEGQQVKKGQPIVRMGNSEAARTEVARAQEALISAERSFSASQADALKELGEAFEAVRKTQYDLDNFDIPSDLAQGTPAEGVGKMYAKVEDARKAYEPYKNLGSNNPTRKEYKKRLDDAWADFKKAIRWAKLEADLQQAQSELDDAQKEFSALTEGSQETSLARAQYETAQINLSAAQAALANVELIAPFDGVVAGLNVKVGASINAGEVAVTVADFSNWLVKTTDLTEIDVVDLSKDQMAMITLDAIPDLTLNGRIESIGQTYAEKQGDIIYEVTILLTEKDPAMRWGMTAEVNFEQ